MPRKQDIAVVEESIEEEEMPEQKSSSKDSIIITIPGVGAATAEKMIEAGYDNLLSVAVASPRELVNTAGVTELTARKIIQFAREKLQLGFESGTDALKKRQNIEKISSGCSALDGLLGGGFETRAITEIYAAFGSGKTQIAHVLAVNCIKQFPDATVVYIDTESTFRPERIIDFAKGAGVPPEKVLEQIKVARAYNSDHQMLLAEKVEDLIKQGLKVKLVVVDSLTAHFRAEFIGRGTLADRQQKLNKHMHVLSKLAEMYNFTVYVTNQVMVRPDVFFGDPTEAIGGHIVAHNSQYRIYLRRGRKGSRVAKLVDSPGLPDGEANFYIDTNGIRDV